jgi:hypothetical protein
MQWERLSFHFSDDDKGCAFHPVPCPHCAQKVARGKLPAHIQTCGKRKSACGYCGKQVTIDDQKRHETSVGAVPFANSPFSTSTLHKH